MTCDHSGGQSGAALYVRHSGRLRLVMVCDECGAVQNELGGLDYKPRPALPPPGMSGAAEAEGGPSVAST